MDEGDSSEDEEDEIDELYRRLAAVEGVLQTQVDHQLKLLGYRHMLLREELLYTRRSLFRLAWLVDPALHSLVQGQLQEERKGMLERILILVENSEPGIAAALSQEFEDDLPE